MVSRNGRQPTGRRTAIGRKCAGALPDPHENVLEGVFRFTAIAQNTKTDRKKFRTGCFIKLVEGLSVLKGNARKQCAKIIICHQCPDPLPVNPNVIGRSIPSASLGLRNSSRSNIH
nr:hypothetical protein [Marinicella sp. W31]MDC2876469.1 hypothetical protein [Marinicella sp. W31]